MIQLNLFPSLKITDEERCSNKTAYNTDSAFGTQLTTNAIKAGKYGFAQLPAYMEDIPSEFITIGDLRPSRKSYECGVSCFDKDEVLEKLWKYTERYFERLKPYRCVIEPDFSLKIGFPLAVQITNAYRNHALAYAMQERGLKVIPNMYWSTPESYDFCFDGHSRGGAVCVSTIGTCSDQRAQRYFRRGFEEMLKRIAPDVVLLYGDTNEQMLSWMPQQLAIQHVVHKRFERARNGSKRII